MKAFRSLWLTALCLFVFSCQPKQPEETLTLTVSPTSMLFKADDASSKLFTIATTGSWTAAPGQSWIRLDQRSGTGNASVTVQVEANASESQRNADIVVTATSGASEKTVTIQVSQSGSGGESLKPNPAAFDGNKRSSTTYQLLIYTFADSDGDGVGDFKGIQNKLDYLDGLGVTALWLSPAHPTSSYHAYDVNDYYALNPLYATGQKTPAKAEADFKDLLAAAHAKGIQIYMDYVLNHSGKHNAWFTEALADASSPYRDFYFISSNPSADYKTFPMLTGTSYKSHEWKQVTAGSPKLTISKTTEDVTNGSATWNLWFWMSGQDGKEVRFVDKGDGSYYLVMDINGSCGMLVRKYRNWDSGSKFGAKSGSTLQVGTPMELVAEGADISFTGSGRYRIDLTDVSTETLYYMGCFSDWMPDLNYGDVSQAENNACFQALAESADKWIRMGVDGLRLDAVKHICGGIDSYNNTSNQTLLKKWYDRCNATYKAVGHTDDIFMVAEAWDSHNVEKNYYKGLTSCFEFDYGYKVRDMLNSGNAGGFVTDVAGYVSDHTSVRADAITSFFLSNHDQDRFASNVNRKEDCLKQAAAILLSGPGKPFIYQGEELGYWGTKADGDENVRQPIAWDAALKDVAKKGLTLDGSDRTNYEVVKGAVSVETQSADPGSLLNVYKTWSRLRNTYPALAEGTMTSANLNGTSIASWYMSAGGQKLLVVHNVAGTEKTVTVSDDMSRPVGVLGLVQVSGNNLMLGGHASVMFEL